VGHHTEAFVGIDTSKIDLIFLGAVNISHEINKPSIAVGPCFERPRTQSADELRRQHAHAYRFDDVPDPVDVVFLAHMQLYMAVSSDAERFSLALARPVRPMRSDEPAGLCAGEPVSVGVQQPSSAIFAEGLAPWACCAAVGSPCCCL
jgi:hypothetical protein